MSTIIDWGPNLVILYFLPIQYPLLFLKQISDIVLPIQQIFYVCISKRERSLKPNQNAITISKKYLPVHISLVVFNSRHISLFSHSVLPHIYVIAFKFESGSSQGPYFVFRKHVSHVFFISILVLRCKSHTIKVTLLKCTSEWILVTRSLRPSRLIPEHFLVTLNFQVPAPSLWVFLIL